MFTVAFTKANIWKQPKCPPTDEWENMVLYIVNIRNATELYI